MLTAPALKHKALSLGFDLCGIAPVDDFPELHALPDWLARGYAGEMAWLGRSAERGADGRAVVPGARCVLVTATLYNVDRPYSNEAEPGVARISRYAWGDDYHDVIEKR